MKKKKSLNWRIVCCGLICLTAAEIYALSKGINGLYFQIFIGVIALAIGVSIENPFKK